LQFEVNGQSYFLTFVEDERRWYVFSPTATGLHRMPVYMDAPVLGSLSVSEKNRSAVN
jgi:hypothetical protein